jgi:uncharacterized protein
MVLTEKLILGTAQLGMTYGISNKIGKPSPEEAINLLHVARRQGIMILDTASGYGDAHQIISNFNRTTRHFDVITKFAVHSHLNFENELKRLLQNFNISSLYCWMYHRFSDTFDKQTAHSLQALKRHGLLRRTGVSIYSNEEFEQAIKMEWIDVIQVPFNLLDNSNIRGSLLNRAKESGKEIHARSIFLQGLFFMNFDQLSEKLQPLRAHLERLSSIAESSKIPISTLALNYAVRNQFIDRVIIGVDSADQLAGNIDQLQTRFDLNLIDEVNTIHVKDAAALLSPVNW